MYKIINGLAVNNRLRLVSFLIGIFSLACVFLLWNTARSFERDANTIGELTDLELRVWQTRNNYNAMRGDIMQVFIADPVTQKEYLTAASASFREHIDQIKEYIDGINKNHLDGETLTIYDDFNQDLQRYLNFSLETLPAVEAVSLTDSVAFNRVRNVLVVDLDRHFQIVRTQANKLIAAVHAHKEDVIRRMAQNRVRSFWFTLLLSGSLLVLTLLIIRAISRSIIAPIQETEGVLHRLSAGELPDIRDYRGKDEFSRMLRSLKLFNTHIHHLMEFVRNVAKNNFAVDARMFDGQGPIAASLMSMRDNLQVAYTSEVQRNWASQGLAQMGEMLRRQQDSPDLYDTVLAFIVKYIGANQGVLYLKHDQNDALDLVAAYAYGRKKHRAASLGIGEGLAGQVYLEREVMLLKQIPADYIKITSGLGEALPNVLIIAPLVTNDDVYGVIEIAGFKSFEPHVVDFVRKIAEELAVIVKAAKVNVKTRELLHESQQQAEALRAQEEEMRQNMEELQATQEGMERMLKEVRQKEKMVAEMLDAIPAPVMVFDTQYKVVQINKRMRHNFAARGVMIDAGTDLLRVSTRDVVERKTAYDRALQGETFHRRHADSGAGESVIDHYSTVRDGAGVVTAGVVISYGPDMINGATSMYLDGRSLNPAV